MHILMPMPSCQKFLEQIAKALTYFRTESIVNNEVCSKRLRGGSCGGYINYCNYVC